MKTLIIGANGQSSLAALPSIVFFNDLVQHDLSAN
jgi:hypothetical protein